MKRPTEADSDTNGETTLRDRAVDTVRQAAHLAQEARRLKALASDAVEEGMRAVARGLRRSAHDFEDVRYTAAYRIKHAPFKMVAVAGVGGFVFGALFAWALVGRKVRATRQEAESETR